MSTESGPQFLKPDNVPSKAIVSGNRNKVIIPICLVIDLNQG
jgi:hypothetical protein